MEIEQTLKLVGLSDYESKVYLVLLKSGSISAGEISKKTRIHRRNIYDILNRLQEKGFASSIIENNKTVFQAVNPRKIRDMLEQQKREFETTLPNLENFYKTVNDKQEIRVFYGIEGLKNVFQDQLVENKEVLILGAANSAFEILPFYFKWYDQDRVKKKIFVKIVSSEKMNKKVPLSEIRIFSKNYANPVAINIYKNKVAIILWKKDPLAIVIENSEIKESYKKYFELIWSSSKKV